MFVSDAIESRRTVRQYDRSAVVPKETLEKIAQLGNISPTANNIQGINILVVTNQALLDKIFTDLSKTWPEQFQQGFAQRIEAYGVKNFTTCDAQSVFFLVRNENANDQMLLIDTGIKVATILYAAKSYGLDTIPIGMVKVGDNSQMEKDLKIPPGSLLMAVAVGKALPNPILADKTIQSKYSFIE
jgi:nitroreductase